MGWIISRCYGVLCDSRVEQYCRFLEFGLWQLKNSLVAGSGGVFPLLFLSLVCLPGSFVGRLLYRVSLQRAPAPHYHRNTPPSTSIVSHPCRGLRNAGIQSLSVSDRHTDRIGSLAGDVEVMFEVRSCRCFQPWTRLLSCVRHLVYVDSISDMNTLQSREERDRRLKIYFRN